MTKVNLSLDVDLGYADMPVPDKIFVPIAAGKFSLFSYKSHPTDPLFVEKVRLQYAADDRLKLSMKVSGRVAVSHFPDLRLGGTTVEIESGLIVKDLKLLIKNLRITQLNLPSLPGPIDKLIGHLLNKFLLKRLSEVIGADLNAPLERAKAQINQPIRFQLEIGKSTTAYEFSPNLESFTPALKIFREGIRLRFEVTFAPELSIVQPKAARSRRLTRGVAPKGRRKRTRRV